jgi:pimeloyl-ACP methyl ester carboxylesterase
MADRETRDAERRHVMYATVGSTDIFYTVAGAGLPCLVPSLAGTPIYERTFTLALGGTLQLIFAELRANRTAVRDVAALTLRALTEDMDALRQALGLERLAVLGHSAHSILALAYAAHFPQRISRVIIVGGLPALSPTLHEQIAGYWEVVAPPDRKQLLAENRARLTDEVLERLTPSERLTATLLLRPDLRLHPALGGTRRFLLGALSTLLGTRWAIRDLRPRRQLPAHRRAGVHRARGVRFLGPADGLGRYQGPAAESDLPRL